MSEFDLKIDQSIATHLRTYQFPSIIEVPALHNSEISSKIEHTILKPAALPADIIRLCEEAKEYHFRSVCIHPSYVNFAKGLLAASEVLVVTVVGFPLGANSTNTKEYETQQSIVSGADEIDVVIHQGRLKAKDFEYVLFDLKKVVKVAGTKPVKVILETCNLTREEIVAGCFISLEAGASFVKTSTGFGSFGAKIEDVHLMKSIVAGKAGVKASGGIKDCASALKMIAYGADLIGTSNGVAILKENKT